MVVRDALIVTMQDVDGQRAPAACAPSTCWSARSTAPTGEMRGRSCTATPVPTTAASGRLGRRRGRLGVDRRRLRRPRAAPARRPRARGRRRRDQRRTPARRRRGLLLRAQLVRRRTDLPGDIEQARAAARGDRRRAGAAGSSAAASPTTPGAAELQRSALTLKGLIHAPTGGMVAALTTSLPETPGGERNWDYRYTWIRDATFTLWGLHVLGLDDEAADFMALHRATSAGDDPHLQIMYGIGGEKELTESTLDHLCGYVGARPVRIGNGASEQRQNDVYGALLDSIYIHSRALERGQRLALGARRRPGRGGDRDLAAARPGDLGGARRAQALRLLEADVLGRARPRLPAGRRRAATASGPSAGAPRPTRSRRTSSPTASATAASSASTTRPTRSTPPPC